MKAIKYIDIIDVSDYADYLRSIREHLPHNTYQFASDPNHYNFYGKFCTHDLKLSQIMLNNALSEPTYTILFEKSKFKHEMDLCISYQGVTKFEILRYENDANDSIGDLIIDEVSLSESNNIVHEMQFWGAEIIVSCKDLVAKWI